MFQFLGFALGMGGSTAVVFLFSKFLRDFDIDAKEADALKSFSELIWVGLGLILISQFSLYIAYPETLAQSGTFLAQIISLFVVVFSGAVLMIIFAPFLAHIPFTKNVEGQYHPSFPSLRRYTFITGAIALSSWYFAFGTNYVPEYSLTALLSAYCAVLVVAVVISILWERAISRGEPEAKDQ